MINLILVHGLRFAALILVQVLVISNLSLGYYVNPYIYPLFIMTFPFSTQQWLLILIGFFTGITVDAFSNSMGMHAAACAFMAFARPAALSFLTPKSSYESIDQPGLQSLGYIWFITYTGLLILLHHLVYFYLEVFSFSNFFLTLGKVFLSTVVSTLLIVLAAMI
ncbi:MAG TPA: rod shape-determining protein MreD, partial [Chitinophagales bacterium]|nr:rod shape-determining protein MreD [Chitinophagales bacterium]